MHLEAILAKIKAERSWAIAHRRYLHQHPELSLQEQNTSQYCQQVLKDLGYQISSAFGYGFVADLAIPGAKKRIAFRAEMDALPVLEQNQHEFISVNQGVAHVCGHDVHMAVALFTAKILAESKADLACHVRFIFQPSEEEIPGGALGMIQAGCLEGVDAIYGLHTLPQAQVGEIWIRQGTLMGTSSPFDVKVIGKGCHAGCPSEGLSPISAAAEIIAVWQALPNEIVEQYPPIVSVTAVHGGNSHNIIPESIELKGALRAFSRQDLEQVQAKIRSHCQALEQRGYQIALHFQESYECVVNQAYGFKQVLQAAAKVPGLLVKQDIAPVNFVEDFCYYLNQCPGAFYFLGGGNPAKHIVHPLHSPHYDVDEAALVVGTSVMTMLAMEA